MNLTFQINHHLQVDSLFLNEKSSIGLTYKTASYILISLYIIRRFYSTAQPQHAHF